MAKLTGKTIVFTGKLETMTRDVTGTTDNWAHIARKQTIKLG